MLGNGIEEQSTVVGVGEQFTGYSLSQKSVAVDFTHLQMNGQPCNARRRQARGTSYGEMVRNGGLQSERDWDWGPANLQQESLRSPATHHHVRRYRVHKESYLYRSAEKRWWLSVPVPSEPDACQVSQSENEHGEIHQTIEPLSNQILVNLTHCSLLHTQRPAREHQCHARKGIDPTALSFSGCVKKYTAGKAQTHVAHSVSGEAIMV